MFDEVVELLDPDMKPTSSEIEVCYNKILYTDTIQVCYYTDGYST